MLQYGHFAKRICAGVMASVDSIIVEYRLNHGGGQALLDWISAHYFWMPEHYTCFGGIGKFREALTFRNASGESFTLLVGVYGNTGKCNNDTIRIDVNPNKIVDDSILEELLLKIRVIGWRFARLVRWDLAIDYTDERRTFLLVRTDSRKREYTEISEDNYTEYLGRRNTPGRYKLYNKSIEANLDYAVTRSELTCSGDWPVETILSYLPLVYHYEPFADDSVPRNISGGDRALVECLIRHPEEAHVLDFLDYRKKKSIRNILAQCSEYSSSCHSVVTPEVVKFLLDGVREYML